MRFWDLLLGRSSNGNGTVKSVEVESEESEEDAEDELSDVEIQNIRKRLKKKVTDPIIPKAVKERMTLELEEGAKSVTESSKAVQKTLCDIDAELDARCPEKESAPGGHQ